jgi:hypothetical protein
MDANVSQHIPNISDIGDPLVNATLVLALATVSAGLIGAFAVWLTAKRSERMLKDQFESNKNLHDEQLRLEKEQHDEQLKQSEEQHQVQGLLEAFRVLNDKDNREARKGAYFVFFEYRRNHKIEVFHNPKVEEVMATFDVMGRLVRSKNISENDFLNVYGSLVYRCWRILEKHIEEERKSRHFDKLMDNFEWLAKAGYKHWKEKEGYDIKQTRLYNPDPEHHEENVDFLKDF